MQKHSSVYSAFVCSSSGVSIRTLLVPELKNCKGLGNTVLLLISFQFWSWESTALRILYVPSLFKTPDLDHELIRKKKGR